MAKGAPKEIKKYSIKDVDSLMESIKRHLPQITEEQVCKALHRNEGYISQLRSRENKEGKPQVSPKFIQTLTQYNARLQNANDFNLTAIAQALVRIENGQHYIRAELQGYGQYQIQQAVGWNQEKFLAAMAKVGKIIGANLEAGDIQDSQQNADT